MNFYRWDTEAEAQAALDWINGNPVFPVISKIKDQPRPDIQRTTKWAEAPTEFADGRWGFPQIPTKRLDRMKISPEARQHFMLTYAPDIEEYAPATWDFQYDDEGNRL